MVTLKIPNNYNCHFGNYINNDTKNIKQGKACEVWLIICALAKFPQKKTLNNCWHKSNLI